MIKKISALVLIAGFLAPNFAFATVEPTGALGPVGGTPAFDGAITGTNEGNTGGGGSTSASEASEVEAQTASDIAGQQSCGDTPGGGSFQRALSRYGARLGDAALEGIAGAVSGRGTAGRAAGDILRGAGIGDVARGLGEDAASFAGGFAGDFVDEQISGACGDSSLGQRICGRIGNVVGNFVEGQVERIGGQLISNGLQSLGISQLGGMFGGVAGGLLGGILGGGEVPTKNDSLKAVTEKVLTEDTKARQNSDTQVELVCNRNPIVAGLGRRMQAKAISVAVQKAAEQQERNPAEELESAGIAGATAYVDTITDPRQRALVHDWTLAEVEGKPPLVDCGEAGGPISTLWKGATNPEQCTPYGTRVGSADVILYSGLQQAQQKARTNYQKLLTSGVRPLGICPPEGLSPGTKNQPELCPDTFRVTTSAKDIESASQKAQQSIFDIDVDAIGEAADNLVADLLEEIFTVVEDEAESGLQRLISNRLSGTSGRSGGSYADRLAGGGAPSEEQGRNFLSSNIVNSIGVETTYQETTIQVINGLTATISTFDQIRSCYAAIGASPTPNVNISMEDARLRAENASTTISRLLGPQLVAHQENLANSRSVVNDLAALIDEARTGTEPAEINATAESYDGLREIGLLRSDADLQYFVDDAVRFLEALALGREDAEAQLAQCQSFASGTPII